ncbi:MAG TPA: trypsin-like peptidase domain-containing protein [Cyclobacteriaceae bacterium]|nr:trypsin-like peptidase domain-containing protein [Cyclobacteriaceae bacterium]
MKTLQTIAIAFIAGLAGAYLFNAFQTEKQSRENNTATYSNSGYASSNETISSPSETNNPAASPLAEPVDFSLAASKAIPSVVYINSMSQSGASNSYWDLLFGGGQQTQTSSGSGVIFNSDGYIVTNNHVVESAEKIQVIYNKKVYDAELIGTDPSTDLGVLKINETNLPAITLGSSKNLQVGEWVVAVGNPFSLSSTVTAGIVSAKGRKINIVEDKFPIESFIQTDAAINPGNSGGALVNKAGELVGINTAILSRTGSYTGYAFAVPVDIAKKIVDDLIKYGIVQKGVFGGKVTDYDFQNAAKYSLPTNVKNFKGVLLEEPEKVGAAKTAGLAFRDIITRIDNVDVNSVSAFEEELAYHYPGDKVSITYLRNNTTSITSVTLLNKYGEMGIVKRKLFEDPSLGATLEADDYGVKVFKIKDGLFKKIGLPENYTIISINRRQVTNPQDVIDFFKQYKGQVLLYGISSSKTEMPMRFNLQ